MIATQVEWVRNLKFKKAINLTQNLNEEKMSYLVLNSFDFHQLDSRYLITTITPLNKIDTQLTAQKILWLYPWYVRKCGERTEES